jgi:hypothetical protein
MSVPPSRGWVAVHEINPLLGEGTDSEDWVNMCWARAHFLSEHMTKVTLLNRFNEIFKN